MEGTCRAPSPHLRVSCRLGALKPLGQLRAGPRPGHRDMSGQQGIAQAGYGEAVLCLHPLEGILVAQTRGCRIVKRRFRVTQEGILQ